MLVACTTRCAIPEQHSCHPIYLGACTHLAVTMLYAQWIGLRYVLQ